MMVLEQVATLQKFANIAPEQVERDLATYLRPGGADPKPQHVAATLQHVAPTVATRLQDLVKKTSELFEQRAKEVEVLVAGLAGGVSVALLGPPGTAKSALVRRVALLCGLSGDDGRYFEYLMTTHTMPEEIFGGPDLNQLVKGKVVRVTTGKLPQAEVAFLDEVFRGGSHILNTLLTIINEKRFDDGSGARHVPLLGLVGASNTAPVDPDLDAFFDRFPIRVWLRSVLEPRGKFDGGDQQAAARLAKFSLRGDADRLAQAWDPKTAAVAIKNDQVACTNDFRFARAYLLQRLQTQAEKSERLAQFERLFRSLRERCRLSDRSFGQLWIFAAALDFVRGKDPSRAYPASDGHVEVFRFAGRSAQDVLFLNDRVEQQTRALQHTGAA